MPNELKRGFFKCFTFISTFFFFFPEHMRISTIVTGFQRKAILSAKKRGHIFREWLFSRQRRRGTFPSWMSEDFGRLSYNSLQAQKVCNGGRKELVLEGIPGEYET